MVLLFLVAVTVLAVVAREVFKIVMAYMTISPLR